MLEIQFEEIFHPTIVSWHHKPFVRLFVNGVKNEKQFYDELYILTTTIIKLLALLMIYNTLTNITVAPPQIFVIFLTSSRSWIYFYFVKTGIQ